MKKSIFIIGPAYPLRGGGITTFNERLCRQFMEEGYDCQIFSFSLQYPSFLFPGSSQFTTDPAPAGLAIHSVINSINPFNWLKIGYRLKKMRPDIVVVRFWLPFMGPALGTILRLVKRNKHSRIIAITDNIIPHEKRPGDIMFTRYFITPCDAFITMSDKVISDLRRFEKKKPAKVVLHPLYDNFGKPIDKKSARAYLSLPPNDPILLFFGFIRHYKGLDLLLEAVKLIKQQNSLPELKLIVAGEFYEDEKIYQELITRLEIHDNLILHTHFISDQEVKYYFCAADGVVQPYRSATQSGVTPLAYHFEKPMIVTHVGSLPDYVRHEQTGLVCKPEPDSIAAAIVHYFKLGEEKFLIPLHNEKTKYSWPILVNAIVALAETKTQ